MKCLKKQQCKHMPFNKGFTLLEILVAVVIFSIGLLGLASLQTTSLKLTNDSLDRTVATILANDMIDRMRANVEATSLGTTSPYNNPSKNATSNPNCYGLNSDGSSSDSAQCDSTQMAQNDFADWYAAIQGSAATSWRPAITALLPSGNGVVCIDSTPNDGTPSSVSCDGITAVPSKPVFSIKIWWIERKDAGTSSTTYHRFTTSFSL